MDISDTSPQAQKVQHEIYRRMPPVRKVQLIFDACRTGKLLAMAGLRQRHPSASDEEVWHMWARQHLGDELYNEVYGTATDEDGGISESRT
ncbi:MAG: hypothetical protein ACYTEQ_21950 [Planctomycetota bacterium]|jgi:hypothetical protein